MQSLSSTFYRTICYLPAMILIITATALASAAETEPADSLSPSADAGQRPNIVFILMDDMGWPDVACFGHQFHETPVIDQLAAEGVKLTDFYAATPVCSSTRSTIQSGQYSTRTGVTNFVPGHWRPFEKLAEPPIEHHLSSDIKTLGEVFTDAGYATGYFGKWHLEFATDYETLHPDPEQSPDRRGYQMTHATMPKEFRQANAGMPPGPKKMDQLTDMALWFIEQNKDRPFFLTISHYSVHIPVESNASTLEKYKNKPKPAEGVNNPNYAAMIEDTDVQIARILNRLDSLGLTDNTLVVFTSDNGGLRCVYTGDGEIISTNAPLRDEKGTLYEGGIRVPFIARWPGVIPADTTCDVPASTIDLMPTFCAAAGIALPEQPLDGESLLPLLRDPNEKLDREAIYFHYPHYHHSRPAGAIRQGDWKLIEFFDDGSCELYNLKDDIGETKDVAVAHPDLVKSLQKKLADWRIETGARMPTANEKYDPARSNEWWNRYKKQPLPTGSGRNYDSRVVGKPKNPPNEDASH